MTTKPERGQLSAHGKTVGTGAGRYTTYLTNMVGALLGYPALATGSCCGLEEDTTAISMSLEREFDQDQYAETYKNFQRIFLTGIDPRNDDDCCVCLEKENAEKGPVLKACSQPQCGIRYHASCLHESMKSRPLVPENPHDPQSAMIPGASKCPNCNTALVRLPLHIPKSSKFRLGFPELKLEEILEVKCKPGEELVIHPWVLFLLKIPRVQVGEHPIPLYSLVYKYMGNYVPIILSSMREDDEIINIYGPVYHVKRGSGPFWRRTWKDENLVRRVGFSIIRSLFSSQDFNDDWMVNQMLAMISREVPVWENAEADCRDWVRSQQAIDYAASVNLNMAARKDKAERIKWVKQQLNTDMSGSHIQFYYFWFERMWLLRLLLVFLVLLAPLFIRMVIGNPSSVVRWTILLAYSIILYRFARFCGYLFFEQMPRLKVLNSLAIWKTCSKHVELPPMMSKGCGITVSKKLDNPCPPEKSIEVYGCVIEGAPVVIPNGCGHDMASAIRIRFLFDRVVDMGESLRFVEWSKKFLKKVKWGKWTWYPTSYWLHKMPLRRREVVVAEDDGSAEDPKNWEADIFVKAEAYVGKVWSKFKPRMIQSRKSALLILIAAFFFALYKWFAEAFAEGHDVYSVNMNALELGTRVLEGYGLGIGLECDASNWDGSVTKFMLLIEKFLLESVVPYRPTWMTNLLNQWMRTTGSSKGVKYWAEWGRRSGDMWTSTFNTLLNILITNYVWGDLLLQGTYNGDDNFIFVRQVKASVLEKYKALGMKMEIVERTNWRDMEFCSGKFYMTDRGVKWGLKPFRQLCKFGINFGRHSKRTFHGLLFGNAMSMLPIAGHVPIFGLFLRSLVRDCIKKKVELVEVKREEWQITDSQIDDIHPSEEVEFMRRYSLTEREYEKLKNWANSITLDSFPCVLEDELFLRCARVDCGFEGIPVTTHRSHEKWLDEGEVNHDWFIVVEEIFCHFVPFGWLWIAGFEMACGSTYAVLGHALLHMARGIHPLLALLLHYLFNQYVLRTNMLRYVNDNQCLRNLEGLLHNVRNGIDCRLARLRRPKIFIFMHDCLGLSKYRITCSFQKILSYGAKLRVFKIRFRRNNRRGRGGRRQPLRAVVVAQPRRRRNARRGRQRGIHPYVVARVNPFLAGTDGIRAPDEFGFPTGTGVVRIASQLGVNANGYGVKFYYPALDPYCIVPNGVDATGLVDWSIVTKQTAPQNPALVSMAIGYRLVAWGVRITADSSLSNSQGHVWISHVPTSNNTTLVNGVPTTEAMATMLPLTEKFAITQLAENPVIIAGRPYDDGIYRFRSINPAIIEPNVIESMSGWCGINVYISGGLANTTTLNVEIIQHIEFVQAGNQVSSFIDAVPGLYEPQIMQMASQTDALMPVGVLDRAIQTIDQISEFTGKLMGVGAKLLPVVSNGVRAAALLRKATGFFNAPGQFRQIGYDEEKY